jgi:hypothetical protein
MEATIERLFEPYKLDTPWLVTNIYTDPVGERALRGRTPRVPRSEKQSKYEAGTIG